MIARCENEFEKYQQMDMERLRKDAELGANRKPRLIEESELPKWLVKEEEEEVEEPDDSLLGRGSRAKKQSLT